MDIEVVLSQCNHPDPSTHKCPGLVKGFFPNKDNAKCTCECHKGKQWKQPVTMP